ncbi:hypothetical protein [Lysinibacillus sp. 54212]|uniref:hypothetical protein n=1 Tax=Lysinibacillus sp. 54212 TaxID=3119829 RepID=UPI002FCA70C6
MEHSKLVAFSLKCNACSRAWSITEEDFEKGIIKCQDPECGNEFTVYEGIKNGLKAEENIIPNPFLANDMIIDNIKIRIGYTYTFELPENVSKVYKIQLFPFGPFLAGVTEISKNNFQIFTSLPNGSDSSQVGNESSVMLLVNAKTDDYEEPWLHFLSYAYDHYLSNDFLTSIMLSEIAFETYVDKTLTAEYLNRGLDEDSVYRLLKATDMYQKVNPLMCNLYGAKLKSCKQWPDWSKRVLEWRNQIAHGTKKTATKEEALLAYQTIVDCIFYFVEAVDRYNKKISN